MGRPGLGMIIITRAQLKFLSRGRILTLSTTGRYHKGRTYAVSTGGRRAVCRAQIIDIVDENIRIRLATVEPPRLLARNPIAQHADYVTEPGRAMAHEPEAVDEATQARLTELGTLRWQQLYVLRRNEAALMTLHERIRRLEHAYARGEASVMTDLRVVRQRLQTLERRAVLSGHIRI